MEAGHIETEVETRSTGTWIHVKGRLDMASAPDLDRQLDALIRDGHRDLVLDLGQLEYVSSAGGLAGCGESDWVGRDASDGRRAEQGEGSPFPVRTGSVSHG